MEYLPLLVPIAVLIGFLVVRPGIVASLVVAVVAALLEAPAIALLSSAGGLECPRGCSDAQDLLQVLVFFGLPGLVVVGLAWALVAALRGRARHAERGV